MKGKSSNKIPMVKGKKNDLKKKVNVEIIWLDDDSSPDIPSSPQTLSNAQKTQSIPSSKAPNNQDNQRVTRRTAQLAAPKTAPKNDPSTAPSTAPQTANKNDPLTASKTDPPTGPSNHLSTAPKRSTKKKVPSRTVHAIMMPPEDSANKRTNKRTKYSENDIRQFDNPSVNPNKISRQPKRSRKEEKQIR